MRQKSEFTRPRAGHRPRRLVHSETISNSRLRADEIGSSTPRTNGLNLKEWKIISRNSCPDPVYSLFSLLLPAGGFLRNVKVRWNSVWFFGKEGGRGGPWRRTLERGLEKVPVEGPRPRRVVFHESVLFLTVSGEWKLVGWLVWNDLCVHLFIRIISRKIGNKKIFSIQIFVNLYK